MEYTSSDVCPEGLQWDPKYDFYDIPEIPIEHTLHLHVNTAGVGFAGGATGIVPLDSVANNGNLLLGRLEGKAGHAASLLWDMFCKSDYELAAKNSGLVVEKNSGCCNPACGWSGWWYSCDARCDPPEPRSSDPGNGWTTNAVGNVLNNKGDSDDICGEYNDNTFTLAATVPEVGRETRNGKHCLGVSALSRTDTLRATISSCPVWIRVGINAIALAARASYQSASKAIPSLARNHPIAILLGKDPESSALVGSSFDMYTQGWYVIMKQALEAFSGANLPAAQRIRLPSLTDFVNRYVVADFVGLPTHDIDADGAGGGGYATFDGVTKCAIGVLRDFDFDDGFRTGANSWHIVRIDHTTQGVSDCPDGLIKCTKKQFMRGLYSKYETKDGHPAYPAQMIDFRQFYDESSGWSDQAETYLAWWHWGQHMLRPVANKADVSFMIQTTDFSGIRVRPYFARIGADMYFDEHGAPVMVTTPDGVEIWKAKVEPVTWQYWKFAWRSSAFLKLTALNHLWATHFTAANAMAAASREALPHTHPLRRLLTIFTFGSIGVNNDAFHQLLGTNSLLHRSTPFFDMVETNKALYASLPSLEDEFGHFISDTKMAEVPPKVKETPYFQDGQLLFAELETLVARWFGLYDWCEDGVLADWDIKHFVDRIKTWSSYDQHFEEDAAFLELYDASTDGIKCDGLKKWLTIHFFHVTGYHQQVGTVADTAIDPDFAGFAWKEGEAFVSPRQAAQLSFIAASTATRWPKLSEDYSFVAQGIVKELEANKVLRGFHSAMTALKKTIDDKNAEQVYPYRQMHPDHVDCSVAV
jgi:hypothetical protein